VKTEKAVTVRRENGFTLIELMVVVLIIAVLAAVAIPVFMVQRERAWSVQVKSTMRNAATAQESFAGDNGGLYSNTVADLIDQGLRFSSTEVHFDDVDIVLTGPTSYCMQASSAHLATIIWHHDSDVGAPREGVCTP
jgi:type IV pilus assembly protein PilA